MIVLRLVFLVFAIAVMQCLLPAIIPGLLLLLGVQAVHGRLIQSLDRIDQVLIRLVRTQMYGPPYAGIDCDVYYVREAKRVFKHIGCAMLLGCSGLIRIAEGKAKFRVRRSVGLKRLKKRSP